MNAFTTQDAFQREMRDKYLALLYAHLGWRVMWLDGALWLPAQLSGYGDTLAVQKPLCGASEGRSVDLLIEEKFDRRLGRTGNMYFELGQNRRTGSLGWLHKCRSDQLVLFSEMGDGAVVHMMSWRPLQAYLFDEIAADKEKAARGEPPSIMWRDSSEMVPGNESVGVVVPVARLASRLPVSSWLVQAGGHIKPRRFH